MYCHHGVCQSENQGTLAGYYIECVVAGVVQAIYSDNNSTPIVTVSGVANRAKSDGRGNFFFFVPDGLYDLKYYDTAGVFQFTETNFSFYDVVFTPAITGAVARPTSTKLRETVSMFDYLTAAEIASVIAGAFATDVTAKVQIAFDDLRTGVTGGLYFPDGGYKLTASITASAATMTGWNVYGQSRAKTIIKQFTNNTPIFTFTVNLMHTIRWSQMTLTWNTAQTGNTSAAAFKLLDGGGAKSLYNSQFSDIFCTNGYWTVDASAALWWGNSFTGFFIQTQGGAFKLNGLAGQPHCYFEGYVLGGAAGVYIVDAASLNAIWNIEVNNTSAAMLSDTSGGTHTVLNWELETASYTGTVTLFLLTNSQFFGQGTIQATNITMAAAAEVRCFNTSGANSLIDVDYFMWNFSGAGITAQGAGAAFYVAAGGGGGQTSLMRFGTLQGVYSAAAATPVASLTNVGGAVTADWVVVDDWIDLNRTKRAGDADVTNTFDGERVIIYGDPITAARKVILPERGTGNGNNLFGGWTREIVKLPQATGAFAITVTRADGATVVGTIPAGVRSGRWQVRWDRSAISSGAGLAAFTFTYLGPLASDTGWTVGTGTELKAAFASYAGATHTAAYVQATIQALDNAARDASQRVLALEKALTAAGIIGA